MPSKEYIAGCEKDEIEKIVENAKAFAKERFGGADLGKGFVKEIILYLNLYIQQLEKNMFMVVNEKIEPLLQNLE